MGARQSTLNHTIAKSLNNEEETHTQISFHNVQMHTHIFSHSDIHAETSSDISSLIQPLIGFGHRVEGVMKDSSNKRQTGGREKERWGSKTRGGRREESLFGRNL